MGSRKEKEAIVILLDVGKNMKQLSDPSKTYLESSKQCISQIVQRKLFSNSVDELGLILFGCKKTNNKLAREAGSGYSNIDVLTDHLSLASWDLLKFINDIDASSNHTADWFDAIMVALDFIHDETETRKFDHYKIVILSNFNSPVSDDQIDAVIGAIKEGNINIVVIGPDVQKEEYEPGEKKSKLQTDGEILISNIVDKVEGSVICTFDDALTELMYVQRKSVRPTPWNVLFTISNQIKIPISAYKKIAEISPMKWIPEAVDDQNAGVVRESAFMKYDKNNDAEVEVPREETVKGYQFGSTVIPFGESEESMGYKSGPKGLYLIGCTARERVPLHLLMGNGAYIVVAKQGDDVANVALNAFIEGLKEQGAVGIARRVYTENSAALIGALFPVVTDEHRYLVYVELPFAEDEHIYKFPSLSDVNPSKEQFNVIDNLIDEMNLDETEERPEMYDLTRIYDPKEQHILRCITEKALNPEKPLSEDLSNADVLRPLPDILESCESTLNKIIELFPLKVIEPKKKKFRGASAADSKPVNGDVKADGLFPTTSAKDDLDDVDEFTSLVNNGKPFLEVCEQMQAVIEKWVSASSDPKKIVENLKVFRKNCSSQDFKPYNECITKVKNIVSESDNFDLWELVQNEKLGLISKLEAQISNVTAQEAEQFLQLPKKEVDSLYGSLDPSCGPSQDLLDEL